MKMAEIKTIYKGESVTLLFTFPEAYDMARLASHKVFVGETEFAGVKDGQTIKLQLKSSDTDRMIGTHRIVCLIDDTTLGLRKPYCGELVIAKTQASGSTASVSNISDIIIPIVISETAVTVGDVLYNYVKGGKGDPFLYSDFTPEQIAELQQPATDAIASIQEVELAVEQAEALRVQAEQDRQTNTATAIQNAEQATTGANNAASLANEKAGLANNAATLANEKAGLAATATTQANTARDGANSAAQSATNLVNTYAAELAAKELKANKQNNLAPDGTGTKFPTVDAVNAGLVASSNLLYQYVHSGNKEVYVSAIDYVTHTFTSVNHGLVNGDRLGLKIISDGIIENVIPFTAAIPQDSGTTGYYVINSAGNTFQISATSGGAAITTINKATQDFSKWRFEVLIAQHILLPNIPSIGCEIEVIGDIMQLHRYVNENSYIPLSTGYIQQSVTSTALAHANTYLLKGWYRISIRKTETSMFVNRKYVGIQLDTTNSARIKWVTAEIMMLTNGDISLIDNILLTSAMLTNGTIINVYKI